MNLSELAKEFHDNAVAHGFWENPNKGERIALMHSELSEALEAVRQPCESSKCAGFSQEVEELADAVIRILDYCAHYNLPIEQAVLAKHEYNKGREYLHGKKF